MSKAGTVLVTGSSRGLGRGIALEAAAAGFSVAIHYARNADAAAETAAACATAAPDPAQRFPIVGGDLRDPDARHAIVEAVHRDFDGIDALVNNAGISVRQRVDVMDATQESWDDVMSVNCKAPHFLTQLVARRWLQEPGASRIASGYKLVFVGSISAEAASPNRAEYCVSKAGLTMLNRVWAARLAPAGVQSVEVRAGIMATDMTAVVAEHYDTVLADDRVVPQARWGTAQDMGLAVRAVLEGRLPFSTGHVLDVDGGFHVRRL